MVVTVPRQTGKTALIRAFGVHRALLNRSVFYTAQTGKDARARWADLVKVLRFAPAFKQKVKSQAIKIALRGGSEHVEFPGGGVFQAFAPTPESLHGYTPPTVVIDEAFAQSEEAGELLMGGIGPAQRTIVDRQVWIVSTMGTAASTFLHNWIDRAAAGLPRVALFYWGCRDDQDPFSLDDIADFHPAVGQEYVEIGQTEGLVTTATDILAEADRMSTSEYVRAYGNRRTATTNTLIPADAWRALGDADLAAPADPRSVTLVYDVDEHSAAASIVAVWTDDTTGLPAVRVVQHQAGTAWLDDAVIDLDAAWRPARVIAAGNGPVIGHTRELIRAGVPVEEQSERDYAAATTGLLTRIRDTQLVHGNPAGDDVLAKAMAGVVTRSSVVDGIAISRRHSVGLVSPAVAAALGLHAHPDQADTGPVMRFSAAG